jgi:histidinol phosphatase-like enzyme
VIIEDRHHIRDPAAVQLCPGAWQLIHRASQTGWPVVVITNQSGILRLSNQTCGVLSVACKPPAMARPRQP